MPAPSTRNVFAAALAAAAAIAAGCAVPGPLAREPRAEIGFVEIDADITLRRMVVRSPRPKGTVLFLHGFPETILAWQEIAPALADDYEVHAIDWPGFGFSSRPPVERFAYAPSDYARVLQAYIARSGIDTSQLTIYATDIGALPALLAALEQPGIARTIIVGDFAPFDRPRYMYQSLQNLKGGPAAEPTRAAMNRNRDEILENTFRRGLAEEAQFEVSPEFKDDMARGWSHGGMSSADAFHHYYSHFTRDQQYFEANLGRLTTPVKVVWGDKDLYIGKEMGIEFAGKAKAEFRLLPGIGHYPHLQSPEQTLEEIRASFQPPRSQS